MEYQVRAINLPSDPFTRGYLECAEWCGLIEDEREAFELSIDPEWDAETLARVSAECEDFKQANKADLKGEDMVRAGHDFFLTRNRHGAGFWDGNYEESKGKRLTESAHVYGETYETFNEDSGKLSSR